MEIAILLNKIAGFSLRAKIETLLNAKSCQRGPGLAAIVINNLLGEDQGSSSLDPVLCLHNNGSFLDNVEMPPAARMGIMANIARNHHIREVVLETRANSVTREMLVEIRHIMAPKRVVMAMGLENANDEIRDLCIHKGLSWRAFERGQGLSP